MNTKTPHIIQEGILEYKLGELKGNRIHYDFEKMLIYLDAKGKLLFGKNFKMHKEDEAILYKLCTYFIRDVETCKKLKIDPNKGILLSGPVGCGKTSLMKLLPHIVPHQKTYNVIPARNIAFEFNNKGFSIIEHYGNNNYYCFDDLGVETTGRHFGKDCNVMGEILLSRYDLFLKTNDFQSVISSAVEKSHNFKNRILTHATTNLNAKELEERYGIRVRSRMRQLFNLIAFDQKSIDKRV
ncbi:ATPase [Polaribacter vadi]|uniref:ATPase n=1 Tax=Polaribacter vadi TaxID=1774273 RepID=A0A1B8TTQ2_9FLAO|nr:ATP-binding protein [Polaribacter vadi]AOW19103.1 ATPase [Polaribacter vadi]OBY63156.1 ATPase [Polaribacter vadi]